MRSGRVNVYINGIEAGKGSLSSTEIKAALYSELSFDTELKEESIPKCWASRIKNSEVSTIEIKPNLFLDLGITNLQYPIHSLRQLKTDMLSSFNLNQPREVIGSDATTSLTLKSIDFYWGESSKENTEIIISAKIYNNNLDSVSITSFQYYLEMGLNKIAEGESSVTATIKPKTEETIKAFMTLNNREVGKCWLTHLDDKEGMKVKLQSNAEVAGREVKFILL